MQNSQTFVYSSSIVRSFFQKSDRPTMRQRLTREMGQSIEPRDSIFTFRLHPKLIQAKYNII